MPTKIKICGITNLADAEKCLDCGVDFIGLVFAESPRQVPIDDAARIARKMAGKISIVGVFDRYDVDKISQIAGKVKLDYLQIYYNPDNGLIKTPPLPLISSIWMSDNDFKLPPYPCQYLLLDFKRVGSIDGISEYDWNMVNRKYDVFLAGGIDPENVSGILEFYKPFGVDTSRGTEKEPGVKDHAKIEEFVERVRSCSE
jgi:phosphoribosylanthranilate isomerase